MTSFQQSCREIRVVADELARALAEEGHDGKGAIQVSERLETEPFRVVVLGEFSRGKSTFVNAIIGEKLLPVAVRPTTAVITVIRSAPSRRAIVRWRDSSRPDDNLELPTERPDKALAEFVSAKNKDFADIARVELTTPLPQFDFPFELIDTPGVNDIDSQREEITYSYLQRADAALLMLDLHQPFSASERRFLEDKVYGNDLDKILFVVNKIDQEPPEKIERALAYVRQQVDELERVRGGKVFPVAAKKALAGKNGDVEALQASRFPAFERELVSFLEEASGHDRTRTACQRLIRLASMLIEELETVASGLEAESSAAGDSLHAAELAKGKAAARLQQAAFDIEASVAVFSESCQAAIRSQIANVRRNAAKTMRAPSFPGEDSVDLLRQDLNVGLREALEVPAKLAGETARTLFNRYNRDASSEALIRVTERPVEVASITQSEEDAAIGIGGAIGGTIGMALLGPFGAVPLGILGGWLGAVVSGENEAKRIEAAVGESLNELEARTRKSVGSAVGDLQQALETEILGALAADREQAASAHTVLERSLRDSQAVRQQKADERRQRALSLVGLVTRLRAIGKPEAG